MDPAAINIQHGMIAKYIHITGIVQGVGFRPFIYQLAKNLSLRGTVTNTSAGVEISVVGTEKAVDDFLQRISIEAPPLSQITGIVVTDIEVQDFEDFTIIPSRSISDAYQPISPDVSICEDCLDELFDPADRRHRYPFINCTNCGPRFTIIKDIPYDRPYTTMADFNLCEDCLAEYQDPMDRRFHAQPVACSDCGPQVSLHISDDDGFRQIADRDHAIVQTRKWLIDGKIIAIKGLGGYHLACDATNPDAVKRLRERKGRSDKPFALMAYDLQSVRKLCQVTGREEELLSSRERPIVLLRKIAQSTITENVAPNQNALGVMLPYTPLHYLILEQSDDFPLALVMTSGNVSEEPIAYHNETAFEKLSHIADAYLIHNRPIHVRCDDSVLRMLDLSPPSNKLAIPYPIRRSRGYAPSPIQINMNLNQVFAAGPELKNTFCLTKDSNAFVSHHIGDMENYETLKAYEEAVSHYERLFRIDPKIIAYDLHPNYLASVYALERSRGEGIQAVGVQHHHAHIASCMADNNVAANERVIGIVFDGTGYGTDGKIWGGEFIIASYTEFTRAYHLEYLPLPGGDKSIQEPWRLALAYLDYLGFEWDQELPPVQHVMQTYSNYDQYLNGLHQQVHNRINTAMNSSVGRLFDAVSALIGVRFAVNYEAQAAIELEAIANGKLLDEYLLSGDFHWDGTAPQKILLTLLFAQILEDIKTGQISSKISAKLHNTLASLVVNCCKSMRNLTGIDSVALSGGVWQNMTLLQRTVKLLWSEDFSVLTHQRVPANDGGISLGQAVIASSVINGTQEN